MINKTLVALLVGCFCGSSLLAQSNSWQINDGWGPLTSGVQMSIATSNSVIAVGSNFLVTIEIKNFSTNVIFLGESSPQSDFKISLKNTTGKKYQLTPSTFAYPRLIRADLKSGESRIWTIAVGVNKYYEPPGFNPTYKDIPPGAYILIATRKFGTEDGSFELESNLLKVQIK